MRKTKKKLLAALLSAAMLTGSVLAPCQADTASAAAKIKTNKTKVTVTVGKTVKVKVKNDDMFYACDALTTVYISDSESWNGIELSALINDNLSADDIFQVKTAE